MSDKQLLGIIKANATRNYNAKISPDTTIIDVGRGDGSYAGYEGEAIRLWWIGIRTTPYHPEEVIPMQMGYIIEKDIILIRELDANLETLSFITKIPRDFNFKNVSEE